MNTKSVQVVMSTYNGEKYLKEQIDSILSQEGVDVRLYIRDDGSSDRTTDILASYLPTFYFMFAVIILECKENRLKGNFYKHLRSTSETMYFIHMYFVAFCALVLYKDDYNNFKSYLICAGGALAVSEIYSWMKNISNRSTTVSRLKHD